MAYASYFSAGKYCLTAKAKDVLFILPCRQLFVSAHIIDSHTE